MSVMYEEDFKPYQHWLNDMNDKMHPSECEALDPLKLILTEEHELYGDDYEDDPEESGPGFITLSTGKKVLFL